MTGNSNPLARRAMRTIVVAIATAMAATTALVVPSRAADAQSDSVRAPKASSAKDVAAREARARESAAAIAQARQLVAAADTQAAIKVLKKATEKDNRNGPLWYELGALLTEVSRPAWRRFVMPAGMPQIITAAESSLARAMAYEPDSAHYAIPYGRVLFATNVFSTAKARKLQTGALQKIDPAEHPQRVAEAADQMGILMWRYYVPSMGRPRFAGGGPTERVNSRGHADHVRENTVVEGLPPGFRLYIEARDYFGMASELDPDNEWYFRHHVMVMSELREYDLMAATARQRARQRPQQAWPWLALGVAEQRLGRTAFARAAFDSGYARLPELDRRRLESLSHVVQHKRRKWYDSLTVDAKGALHELFWNTANPSMLLDDNLIELEYRSRIVDADLRFTDDEKRYAGSLSDRGQILIRYGLPDAVMGTASSQTSQTWSYYRENLRFSFFGGAGYGSRYMTPGSWTYLDSLILERPTAWSNIAIMRNRVDSVSAQVARFRARGDSMDVAVYAGIRTGTLRRGGLLDTSVIRNGVFFVDALGRAVTQSTGSMKSGENDTLVMTPRSWFVRAPANVQAVRIEALEPDLLQAARSITSLEGFRTNGFGMSDVLVAAQVAPPAGRDNARWSEYAIAPAVGNIVPRNDAISLLWETYEPATVDGNGRVSITVTVERETGSGLIALAGRIVGGLREAMTGNRRNAVGTTYERRFGAAPMLSDHLRLDLGPLEPGNYRVTVSVTDMVANATDRRVQRFTILR